jgi:hypothetical protein
MLCEGSQKCVTVHMARHYIARHSLHGLGRDEYSSDLLDVLSIYWQPLRKLVGSPILDQVPKLTRERQISSTTQSLLVNTVVGAGLHLRPIPDMILREDVMIVIHSVVQI